MTAAPLERALFLLTQYRLLLVELVDVDRQLRRLAARVPPRDGPLLDEIREQLAESVAAGRSALDGIEELIPVIEARTERTS